MNTHQLIDRFCESRRRWLIVTAVTFVLALVTVLPQVDQYLSLRADENEKTEELAEAGRTAGQLPGLRSRTQELTSKVEELERRTLPDGAVGEFRSQLVDLARESGCQVRRIGVGAVRERPWMEDDNPLAETENQAGKKTPFNLQTRPVNLSVTGSIAEVRDLLSRIESHEVMMHAKRLELRPSGRSESVVQMEIELWCFALSRAKGKA